MSTPPLLERAKTGEAEAIAALLNHNLQSQGIQVRAAREAYHLTLWVEAAAVPTPDMVVPDLRHTIEKLDIPSLGILTIIGQMAGDSAPSWREEFSLLAAYAEGPGEVVVGITASAPHPRADAPTVTVMAASMVEQAAIETAYAVLDLPAGTSLSEVDAAYFRLKSLLLKQGNRKGIVTLQSAHKTLRQHLVALAPSPSTPAPSPLSRGLNSTTRPTTPAELLQILFRQQGLPVWVRLEGRHLYIQLPANEVKSPHQATGSFGSL
ncbi:MAG: hypothetical protein O2890_10380, partial [Cyanobacteria bacterium]|nr:hypothetical protein [Cyanobacteriota bacterium]